MQVPEPAHHHTQDQAPVSTAFATEAAMSAEGSRIDQLRASPAVREGAAALARTAINAIITFADIVPGVGDGASWGADIAKVLRHVVRLKGLDLTPDVSRKIALGTEIIEPFSLFLFPTHGIEAGLQFFKHDKRRIGVGVHAVKSILLGRQKKS